MRKPNLDLEKTIRIKTLELLQEKEPYEIGMRDIATKCGVSATSIYLYYKDKDDLFRKISLDSLETLKNLLVERMKNISSPLGKMVAALKAFRDWSFENSKTAMLFMGKIPVDENADASTISKYYSCNRLGQELLKDCIKEKIIESENPELDTDLIIFGLWGCIESILNKRSSPQFWDKRIEYTDRFIEMSISALRG